MGFTKKNEKKDRVTPKKVFIFSFARPSQNFIKKKQKKNPPTHAIIRFYKTARKDHRALHWSREIMIWTLHSFYCRSSGMVPLNVAELDIFWTTGNIPTRNLHRLQPQTFISHAKECYNRCGLCSTSFQNNELIYQLPCGDRFHITHDAICRTDNLKIILRNNNQCPSCCDRVVLCETER